MEYLTTQELATALHRRREWIWKVAKRKGLGQKIAGRYVFTPEEAAQIAERMGKVGRPKR